ncbi:MAG: hypothetical protein AAGF94_19680 [Pseudomonadota bacterium]
MPAKSHLSFAMKLACLFIPAAFAGPLAAQVSAPKLALELNNSAEIEGACRLTFVATNETGVALEGLSYEIVLYDPDGIVPDDGFLLFEFGRMPEGKTKVVQFVLENRDCGSISRVLVNDVAECRSAAGSHEFCLDGLSVSSRNAIEFSV